MPRMKILSSVEQESFDKPPVLNGSQRKQAFYINESISKILLELRGTDNKIGFLLSYGYFIMTRKFFHPLDFHSNDISHVIKQLEISAEQLVNQTSVLVGNTFVVSGVFEKVSRTELKKLILLDRRSINAYHHLVSMLTQLLCLENQLFIQVTKT